MNDSELIKLIQGINEKIETIMGTGKQEYHFHIEKVMIETLQLDELSYHLDKIDVKELSGMLNLGNSFSPSVESTKSQSSKPPEKNVKKKKGQNEFGEEDKQTDEKEEALKSRDKDDEYIENQGSSPVLKVIIDGKEIIIGN
ncbi:MAG TPA: hypothetical protein DCR24_01710 [Bacillus bacterium]|nr:hypothetical protein [Bacillus sp. (in: firmicutes)]